MANNPIVDHETWLAARLELLKKEKDMTRLRDELTEARIALPWEAVEKDYQFRSVDGDVSLAELFGEQSQLLMYHFMFGPEWEEGCKICSMLGDHYDPLIEHLAHRDVRFVTVSRAKIDQIEAFKSRKGWTFPWYSSFESDFNQDYCVSFSQDELDSGEAFYNYQKGAKFPVTECPGISSFAKDENGNVFHTYSSFGRGLENFLGIYNFLDIAPRGRDEQDLPFPMAWVRHKDQYGDDAVDPMQIAKMSDGH